MVIEMCECDKLDKTFASDLYLIYKRSCISDKDQLLMFYLSLNGIYIEHTTTKRLEIHV